MVITLHGKGSKTRRVPLMDPTARMIEDYLDPRAPHRGVGTDADPLFNGPEQTRLTRWGVTKILARHVESLRRRDPGYAPGLNITPHVIRRTRAMHLLQAKVNMIYIRDLLGHADISRDCPRNCVGPSERDRYAYYYEKQGHPEAQQRVGAGPGA
jgi:integrase/recombinase XerD